MIKENPIDPNEIISASYDGNLRIWDLRKIQTKNGFTKKIKVGDQCWDFAINVNSKAEILTAVSCIYDGAYIFGSKGNIEVEWKKKYSEHKSIVYGVDINSTNETILTCSFYDSILKLWKL